MTPDEWFKAHADKIEKMHNPPQGHVRGMVCDCGTKICLAQSGTMHLVTLWTQEGTFFFVNGVDHTRFFLEMAGKEDDALTDCEFGEDADDVRSCVNQTRVFGETFLAPLLTLETALEAEQRPGDVLLN